MKNNKKRGILASAGALVTAVALALGGAAAAQAAPPQPVPANSQVTITKLEQPATAGGTATGAPIGSLPSATIDGVVFDYYLVTNTGAGQTNDIGTNAGQGYAAGLTASSAPISGAATGSFPATASGGVTTLTLPRGLYVVKESSAPAGVVPAVPFLLAVPLTNPTDPTKWLDNIYVYPKNAKISAAKTVSNATKFVVGDTVTWTIDTAIPRVPNPAGSPAFLATDAFVVQDTLTNAQLTTTASATDLRVTAPAGLTRGTGSDGDYNVVLDTTTDPAKTTVKVVFTAAGLGKLAQAVNADANAKVTVELDTVVKATGKILNSASIFPNQTSITDSKPIVTDPAEVRYGNYNVQKTSSDASKTGAALDGAVFRVYTNLTDAKAGNANFLKPSTQPSGEWTTANGGHLSITGLRDSDWANGAQQSSSALNQTYYLVEVKALPGHQLLAEPIAFQVTQTTGVSAPGWVKDLDVQNQATTGGFVLPLTGGMGTAILTIGGIAILAIVLLVARRRRDAEASAE